MIYQQLALISSILAGFAFTFFAAVLFQAKERQIHFYVLIATIISTLCMFICTLGWSFIAISEHLSKDSLGNVLLHHHRKLSLLFLLGILALITCLGLSGWLHSKKAGWVSSGLSIIALWYMIYLLSNFIF